jgi:hypothetical protein
MASLLLCMSVFTFSSKKSVTRTSQCSNLLFVFEKLNESTKGCEKLRTLLSPFGKILLPSVVVVVVVVVVVIVVCCCCMLLWVRLFVYRCW